MWVLVCHPSQVFKLNIYSRLKKGLYDPQTPCAVQSSATHTSHSPPPLFV